MRNVLASLDLHGHIVAADTMGTQAAFARQITAPGGDYLAAIKGNRGSVYEDMRRLSEDREFLDELRKDAKHHKKGENTPGQIQPREYWQTDDLNWLTGKDKRSGTGYERTATEKNGSAGTSRRYFLSSYAADAEMFTAAGGHWRTEATTA